MECALDVSGRRRQAKPVPVEKQGRALGVRQVRRDVRVAALVAGREGLRGGDHQRRAAARVRVEGVGDVARAGVVQHRGEREDAEPHRLQQQKTITRRRRERKGYILEEKEYF